MRKLNRRAVLRVLGLGGAAFGSMGYMEQEIPDPQAPVHVVNNDPYWGVLNGAKIAIDDKRGIMTASFTDQIRDMNGQRLSIGGFILPLDTSKSFNHFVLTRRNSSCPFCPPNEPTEAVEVFTDEPMEFSMDEINVTGHFETIAEATDGLFYRFRSAKVEIVG